MLYKKKEVNKAIDGLITFINIMGMDKATEIFKKIIKDNNIKNWVSYNKNLIDLTEPDKNKKLNHLKKFFNNYLKKEYSEEDKKSRNIDYKENRQYNDNIQSDRLIPENNNSDKKFLAFSRSIKKIFIKEGKNILTNRQYKALSLYFLQEVYKPAEIARKLRINRSSAGRRLKKGLKRLNEYKS